ncbi:hypothetical protein NLJ89_g8136 [Agrocybe chaxingu]|uniref:Uncharacterized protein n=1 Tax=Agrocybe chaxingu TaxID=84603 RepID=A0A9W8MUD7_9AGAR|nr:hypothetical protein NLJ89_g8136 [Agrocybe chaxingu]
MALFNPCTLRRLLSDTRTWPSARHFLPSGNHVRRTLDIHSRRAFSTIYTWNAKRPVDIRAKRDVIEHFLFLLRREVGRNHGFANRDDDYISVRRLLNHPHFRSLDFITLQRLVDLDPKRRIRLKFDPSKPQDYWWIHAKPWNDKHYIMRPATHRDSVISAVYETTLQDWNDHIGKWSSRNGIPRGHDEYIAISRGIPSSGYLETLQDQKVVYIFLDFEKCLRSGIHFLMPGATVQQSLRKTHMLLTRGNEMGYIPPNFFSSVEFVTLKKNVLWGEKEDDKAFVYRDWDYFEDKEDEYTYDEHGRRKTLLEDPWVRVDGFADYVGLSQDVTPPLNVELLEEARETLSVPA